MVMSLKHEERCLANSEIWVLAVLLVRTQRKEANPSGRAHHYSEPEELSELASPEGFLQARPCAKTLYLYSLVYSLKPNEVDTITTPFYRRGLRTSEK